MSSGHTESPVGASAEPDGLAAVARSPQARELVSRYAAQAQRRMSGEEFLKMFDKTFRKMAGVPISSLATVAQAVYVRMGVKTGKERTATIDRPVREAFLALLCSLARNGQLMRAFHPATDGCVVEAALPSDLWSFEGTVLVTLQPAGEGTRVRASTVVRGQLFDWGKSDRCLETLLTDMRNIPVFI
jgi:hypothetical protein